MLVMLFQTLLVRSSLRSRLPAHVIRLFLSFLYATVRLERFDVPEM
jgi:hypothetical protein